MKKIVDYRKLLGVNKTADLKELKTVYRNFMKELHPDKFRDEDEQKKIEADGRCREIIEAYHFLVSISAETQNLTLEEYAQTVAKSSIVDFQYTGQTLKVEFADGSSYEYFDVPKATYIKLINSDSPGRFARRHIYNSYLYRNVNKQATA